MSLRLRWGFYGATLGLIVLQSISALMAGTSGDNLSSNKTSVRDGFIGYLCVDVVVDFRVVRTTSHSFDFNTGLTVGFMDRISYHKRPESTHFLTRAYVHFSSFCFIAFSQLVFGILLLAQIHKACHRNFTNSVTRGYACATPALAGSLGLASCIFALATALIIKRAAAPFSDGLRSNIAHLGVRRG
ncbi:uncharacterized protein LACBIDRAFT_304938 [Laccaria bicolor S238N-H82]|uniref:Predicted protein n=1 Tax=Laccaria bicolor (strain S238N-H82 / ATCC MYA-4686) TaxID=486041 RepID=B0DMP6_LACBS|nr:uncharacterized protein LACBIDRAFT_304938 [Laccaria bicolor S238N-H82]EDR04323.1 predicted protein [Laccaria bicolor S238N-H82]|eukprot:XP_001885214.1 predicted protein [Laccaria bicolor S238N-H82]